MEDVVKRRCDPRSRPAGFEAELAELRARVGEQDELRERLLEREERLDFADRLLTRQREAGRLQGE